MHHRNMTGIYLTTKLIMDNLDYIKVLRDDIGLNLAIIGFNGQLPQVVMVSATDEEIDMLKGPIESLGLVTHPLRG